MAGIGVKLNKIYSKNSIVMDMVGFGYSTVITIAPMFLVIGAIIAMEYLLKFNMVVYSEQELFSSTVMYIFIFSLLTASPFNAVISRYLSDVIFDEKYADIIPCYNLGLLMNTVFSSLLGIPFCIREAIVGEVRISYVFITYCGYMALMFAFYTMLYLSICKVYKSISLFFGIGMGTSVIMSLILYYLFKVDANTSMLLSLTIGFIIIASLEYALIRNYFKDNSNNYRGVLIYFKKYWQLVFTNFLYTIGLYMHNFIFWTTDYRLVVAKSFVCMKSYDLATCIAMFTNISATVIFISRVEMHFHERYKNYSESVIGGRGMDIENAKGRMFEQLSDELMNLVRIQFIVTVVIFFLAVIFLPKLGFGGLVTQIYPCLAAGYFILFIMYAALIFLYYYNDLSGALVTAVIFSVTTIVFTFISTKLTPMWYGIGFFIGAFVGWLAAYNRLRYIEKHIDTQVFCKGQLVKNVFEKKPDNKVYSKEVHL